MKDFFVCKTVEQFKLACWLVEQGISADMFSAIDTNVIAVDSPGNVCMEARWVNGHAEINPDAAVF